MNFYLIIVVFTCITLERVIASPLIKPQESHGKVSESRDIDNIERIEFNAGIRGFSVRNVSNLLARFFEIVGTQNTDLIQELSPWPEAQIPYIIDDYFNGYQTNIIMDAIEEFHKYTCIRFVPYNGEQAHIRIMPSSNGCYSTIGYTDDEQNVYLESDCAYDKGTVMHELMHVIGFGHEHSRHDRDDYVTILWDNIKSGAEHNFYTYQNTNLNDFGLPYDFGSIMHYSDYEFSGNGGKTIIPKLDLYTEMGQREGFSRNDIKKMNKMYECRRRQK